LRALGHCIRCKGKVVFTERAVAPVDPRLEPDMLPHQVLGAPRIDL
jgi:hypothetical protein